MVKSPVMPKEDQIPKIVVLILNWNGWRDTLDCLESLYADACPDCQVVLLDNDSCDGSLEVVRQWADGTPIPDRDSSAPRRGGFPLPYLPYDRETAELGGVAGPEAALRPGLPAGVPHPLILVRTGANLGFAGGNNVGIRYALKRGADYVLLLNNDAVLKSRNSLAQLVGFLDANPRAGACGGRLLYPDGSPQSCYGNFPSLPRTLAFLFPAYKLLPAALLRKVRRANVVPDGSISLPLAVDYPSGACFLVRSRTVAEVGLLDERFFMYAEETDWCLRMKRHGWGRYYVPAAEIVHKVAGSFAGADAAPNRYFTESLFKYYRKNFSPWRLWLVAAGYLVRSLYCIALWSLTAALTSGPRRRRAQERARHWSHCLKLSVRTLTQQLSGGACGERDSLCGREPS